MLPSAPCISLSFPCNLIKEIICSYPSFRLLLTSLPSLLYSFVYSLLHFLLAALPPTMCSPARKRSDSYPVFVDFWLLYFHFFIPSYILSCAFFLLHFPLPYAAQRGREAIPTPVFIDFWLLYLHFFTSLSPRIFFPALSSCYTSLYHVQSSEEENPFLPPFRWLLASLPLVLLLFSCVYPFLHFLLVAFLSTAWIRAANLATFYQSPATFSHNLVTFFTV